MPDQRELYDDPEEALRAAWAGIRNHMHTSMPAVVAQDSNGHTVTLQAAIKRTISDAVHDKVTYEDFPLLLEAPVHHPGGGPITHTFPVKAADEVVALFASRAIDFWHQNGGVQQPAFNRLHSLSDAMMIPGFRSDPRRIQQMATDSAQVRTDDKHHVDDLHPTGGFHRKTVDPSTPPASAAFDPFTAASKFFEHLLHPTNGSSLAATDGGTTHAYGLTHALGHVLAVANGLHSVLAHPTDGAALTAKNLLHKVLAHPDLGALLSAAGGAHTVQAHPTDGIKISSSTGLSISVPPGTFSLPSGAVSSDALGAGAAAGNIGALGGDLSGTLPNPSVVGATGLPLYPTGAAALAALGPGKLYINTQIGAVPASGTSPAVASFYSQGNKPVCVT